MSASASSRIALTGHELEQIDRANASGRQPVVFIHGLWLLPGSWDRWAALFEKHGYIALLPGWPDDPESVDAANAHPESFARKSIGEVADHFERVARALQKRPVLIGHSFGGLLAQILAGRGLAAATIAISPAPFRGVLPLPFSALRSAWPVLGNPANVNRAVPLTFEQFRYAFANALDEEEAHALYESFAVPAAGRPLFQAATANLDPWTEDRVDVENAERGPMLLICGEADHTVPPAIVKASYRLQQHNAAITEMVSMQRRGHALTIDRGWMEVAQAALAFTKRFARTPAAVSVA
jgi:pimeloyl-ACP methyl ester carboxylesterase